MRKLLRDELVVFLCLAIVLSGCATTAELQKKHASFDSCFRQEKTTAMLMGAAAGGLLGILAGNDAKSRAIAGTALAALGGVIGNRVAWQSCMTAFPVKSQTTVVNDRATTLAQAGVSATQTAAKALTIENVSAEPLEFGKDMNVNVTYKYINGDPAARDVKAKVSRNLIFVGPDGVQQEVVSSTEDTIQQGISRATFAIPTPSIEDAKELTVTKDWKFKFVVDVDGMRQEKIVPLNVPLLSVSNPSAGQSDKPAAGQGSASDASPPKPATAPLGTVPLKKGTRLYSEATLTKLVVALPADQTATVIQRIVRDNYNWVQVRLGDGKEGWVRGARK